MKKSVVTTYSFLVVLALIFLAGWIGYTFFTGTSERQTQFKENLSGITNQISSLLKETENPGSDSFKAGMEEFLQSRPEIKGLLIYSDDNRLFYTRLESKNNRLMDNLQKNELYLLDQIKEGTYKPPVGINHDESHLASVRGTSLEISYLYETFSPRQIYDLLLVAIYIIAGLFVLTLILLVSTSVKEKSKGVEKNDDFFEPPAPEPSQVNESSFESTPEGNNDFGLPEEENLQSLDFDLPDSSSEERGLSDLDFNLPEESDLGSMDFDLPGETSDEAMDSMDFSLPEISSEESDLEERDFDLPTDSSEKSDLEEMDFDLPDDSAEESDLEEMDFDLPDDSSEEGDLEEMDFDLPTDSSEEGDLEEMDFDLPDESDSLDEGGDLFGESTDLEESEIAEDDLDDLPDEVDDLLEDLSDEDILGDESFEIDEADEIEDLPDLEDFMADESLMEEDGEPNDETAEEEEHQLYSPRSQVCWENFIDDRLPQEIDRASGENEDLSFVYLRDNTVENDEDYRSFAEDLTGDFPYRDLIFEWGDQGFAMILPNSDLVETLEKLDVFVNERPDRDVRIGVTSRNGRLLDKDQLIEEASSAISRTSTENKIVGFRADPERYRIAVSEEKEE